MKIKVELITKKIAATMLLALFACSAPKKIAISNIVNPKTEAVLGSASFIETKEGILFKVNLQAKKNATLGIHIHQYGDCSDLESKSAGGHWNPTEEIHGMWSQGSFHSGDLGNIQNRQKRKGKP